MITDETLYRRFIKGDDGALHELMERYGDKLTFYINRYVHDIHNAEDLMIEAFSYLAVKKPAIRDGGFKPYLYKSARHLALRHETKARGSIHFGFDDIETEPESELICEFIKTNERNQTLFMCMEQLNPDYREVLYLLYFENMSYKETAIAMGKNEKQVDNLVQRGKKSLRAHLERDGITRADY